MEKETMKYICNGLYIALTALTTIACTSPHEADEADKTDNSALQDSPGGEVGCTAIGCMDQVVIGFEQIRGWPHGDYTFTVTYGENQGVCQATLPFDESRTVNCDGWEVSLIAEYCDPVEETDGEVTSMHCEPLDPAEHGFKAISMTTPEHVESATIRIERDGELMSEQTFENLEYEPQYINGPSEHCPAACESAHVTMDVSLPNREEGEYLTMEVAPFKVPCVGAGIMFCYQVREDEQQNWSNFYNNIKEFDQKWEWGTGYHLHVFREEITDPPADGSSAKYTLVSIESTWQAESTTSFQYPVFGDLVSMGYHPSIYLDEDRLDGELLDGRQFTCESQAICGNIRTNKDSQDFDLTMHFQDDVSAALIATDFSLRSNM